MKRDLLFGGLAGLGGWFLAQLGSILILQMLVPEWLTQYLVPILVTVEAFVLCFVPNAKSYGIRIAVASLAFVILGFLLNVAPWVAAGEMPLELAGMLTRVTTIYCFIGFLAGIVLALPASVIAFYLRGTAKQN